MNPTFKGRGDVKRLNNLLVLTCNSGIGINGDLQIRVLADNKIILITSKELILHSMPFQRHPSERLNKLYSDRYYQGANPFDAKILFIGRDANWSEDIVDDEETFKYIEEYLNDGVDFWKKYRVHHPFMLNNYSGDGKRYHKQFSKLKVPLKLATKISFVELIGFPTTGMASNNRSHFKKLLLSPENNKHLKELDALLINSKKTIFIAWGLINDFNLIREKVGLFKNITKFEKQGKNRFTLHNFNNFIIHPHFSDSISNHTLSLMATELNRFQ